LSGQQLGVFATSAAASAQFQGAVSGSASQANPLTGQAAAGAAGLGLFTGAGRLATEHTYQILTGGRLLYRPVLQAPIQLNGCTLSSVSCHVVVFTEAPPPVVFVDLPSFTIVPVDDFDLLLPGISNQEY